MHKTRQRTSLLVLGIVTSALIGCATQQMSYKNPTATRGVKHSVKRNFFLWGLVGADQVNLEKLCPDGVAEIASETSYLDGWINVLTAGLYSPVSIEVHCQSGQAYRAARTGDSVKITTLVER